MSPASDRAYEAAERLGRAIARACAEHSVPNSFGFGELAGEYNCPEPMLAGRVIRRLHGVVARSAGLKPEQLTVEGRRICVAATEGES